MLRYPQHDSEEPALSETKGLRMIALQFIPSTELRAFGDGGKKRERQPSTALPSTALRAFGRVFDLQPAARTTRNSPPAMAAAPASRATSSPRASNFSSAMTTAIKTIRVRLITPSTS